MPGAGRLGDKASVVADTHGCIACPHPATGPMVSGSPNVLINGRPAARVGDKGIHAACCGTNTFEALQGSATVFINGKPAHRTGDATKHCGGIGKLIEGSQNVFIGGGSSAGGGGGGGGTAGASALGGSGESGGGAGPNESDTAATSGASMRVGSESINAMKTSNQQGETTAKKSEDETIETRFRVVQDSPGHVSGVAVVVEHDSGRRETLKTDSSGEIVIKHKRSESFRIISIDDKEGVD